jgi:hypothetical protein
LPSSRLYTRSPTWSAAIGISPAGVAMGVSGDAQRALHVIVPGPAWHKTPSAQSPRAQVQDSGSVPQGLATQWRETICPAPPSARQISELAQGRSGHATVGRDDAGELAVARTGASPRSLRPHPNARSTSPAPAARTLSDWYTTRSSRWSHSAWSRCKGSTRSCNRAALRCTGHRRKFD